MVGAVVVVKHINVAARSLFQKARAMLIKEEIFDGEGDDLIIRKTFDVSSALDLTKRLEDAPTPMSDAVAVGVIPEGLIKIHVAS